MAIISVIKENSFGQWREKTNDLAQQQGDLALLETPVTTSIVDALNSIEEVEFRRLIVRALAAN